MEYNQPTNKPVPKVAAAGVAGAIVTAVILIANVFGIVIPEEVSGAALTVVAAVTTIVSFAAGYFRKDVR